MTTPTDDLAQALREIAEWKPPQVESRGKMVSMGVAIGSNGERDYFRRLAKQALEAHESRAQSATFSDADAFGHSHSTVLAVPAQPASAWDDFMLMPKDIHPDDEVVDCSGIRNALNQRPGSRVGFSDELSLLACWWERITAAAPQPPAKGSAIDTLYTQDEVNEAMELLRHYRSSIPSECLDQMESALLASAQENDDDP